MSPPNPESEKILQPEKFEPTKTETPDAAAQNEAVRQVLELPESEFDEGAIKVALPPVRPPKPLALMQSGPKSRVAISVEKVLEQDLKDIYGHMTPAKKAEFKKVGEETATKIGTLIRQAQVKITEIFELIKKWLQIIPGVNKFFLEQEAKIKTDEILNLREDLRKKGEI